MLTQGQKEQLGFPKTRKLGDVIELKPGSTGELELS